MKGKLRYVAFNLFLGNSLCLSQRFFILKTIYHNSFRALQETFLLNPLDLSNFHPHFSNKKKKINFIKTYFMWQCLLCGGVINRLADYWENKGLTEYWCCCQNYTSQKALASHLCSSYNQDVYGSQVTLTTYEQDILWAVRNKTSQWTQTTCPVIHNEEFWSLAPHCLYSC